MLSLILFLSIFLVISPFSINIERDNICGILMGRAKSTNACVVTPYKSASRNLTLYSLIEKRILYFCMLFDYHNNKMPIASILFALVTVRLTRIFLKKRRNIFRITFDRNKIDTCTFNIRKCIESYIIEISDPFLFKVFNSSCKSKRIR